MKFLLLEAAKCFDDGYSPFQSDWLSKNNVTLDECMSLSELTGTILRGVALSDKLTQAKVLIQSVLT
jgi:hypothetical protein